MAGRGSGRGSGWKAAALRIFLRLEFELLRLLYRQLGRVCSRDDIMAALYPHEKPGKEDEGSENRLDSLVRHLRKAIEPTAGTPRYLLTVRGLGYKLVDTPTAPT